MTFLTRVGRVLVTNTAGANTGTSLATIANGDILILNRAMNVEAALNTDKIFIAQGLGSGAAIFGDSNGIQTQSITKITHRPYVAPTQQIINLAVPTPTNNTNYRLKILFKDDQRPAADARPTTRDFYAMTDSSATAQELAIALIAKINSPKEAYLRGKVFATMMTATGTFTALTNNATVTSGSPTVTATAHGLTAGALVRIGGTTTGFPVYRVKSITNANTFVLDSPYQGASGTVTAANIGAVTATTDATIQLTTVAIPAHPVDTYSNYNIAASISPSSNSSVSLNDVVSSTTVQTANPGSGFWMQVRDMEFFASGYTVGMNRTLFPVPTGGPYSTRAVEGGTYSIVVIEFWDKHTGDFQKQMESPKNCVIAFNISGGTTKRDAFLTSIATVSGKVVEAPTIS